MYMTKKQFKEALLRGQGRCIRAVQDNPDKYYTVVLWACSNEVTFDAQCDGTRAWFVYQLISFYQDKASFFNTIISSIQKTRSDGGWKMLYLAELLGHFAADGDKLAEQALWNKYQELYKRLNAKNKSPEGVFPERDDFEMICLVLADNKRASVKIAEDIGNLYLTRPFYAHWNFDWLYADISEKYIGTLRKFSINSKAIAEFIRVHEEVMNRIFSPTKERTGRRLSAWLKNKADSRLIEKYVEEYLAQYSPEKRAKALEAFSICPFPADPSPIIEDTKSDNEKLKIVAWQALEKIRHPLVREFAMEQLYVDTENALPVFIRNYMDSDAEVIDSLVKSIPVDFKENNIWHGIQIDILRMVDHGLKAPASLLFYIYESTYCSYCREHALKQLGKRRLLTNEILEECLNDSNSDIRAYASRCLKRRKR